MRITLQPTFDPAPDRPWWADFFLRRQKNIVLSAFVGGALAVGCATSDPPDQRALEPYELARTSPGEARVERPLLHRVFFEEGAWTVGRYGTLTLDKTVAYLQTHKGTTVELYGFAGDAINDARAALVSRRRADTVADYLMSQGISSTRIQTMRTGTGMAADRHVEVRIYPAKRFARAPTESKEK